MINLNLSILALSASHICSISPIFVRHNIFVSQTTLKYFIPTIFYNPRNIQLENSFFVYGLGSLIRKDMEDTPNPTPAPSPTPMFLEIYNHDFSSPTEAIINTTNREAKYLCIIRDCHFNSISMEKDNFISINQNANFYMTSCVFNTCSCSKSVFISLAVRASTISHICCYNMIGLDLHDSNDDRRKNLFIYTNSPDGSFLKLFFSTFVGNREDSKAYDIIYLQGKASTRFQCNNITDFKISHNNENTINDRSILDIRGPRCLYMVMNTLYNLEADCIFYLNSQDKTDRHDHYIGFTNFINHRYHSDMSLIRISMYSDTYIMFSDCYFSELENNIVMTTIDTNSYITIQNCIFDEEMDKSKVNDKLSYDSSNVINNDKQRTPNILAHFFTEEVCRGNLLTDAHGCQDDHCPDYGCTYGAFEFGKDDFTYTQKIHLDVDTPSRSPTMQFSQSKEFSSSFYFSNSHDFSRSSYFSVSNEFSNSFSFSKSTLFSDSANFSKSTMFSSSIEFSFSKKFSESSKFSSSFFFSNSEEFSKTEKFSGSTKFSESSDFTLSTVFTPSNNFTDSDNWDRTHSFTPSQNFSSSNSFSSSFHFTYSKYFSETEEFSETVFFTKSSQFSLTDDFSSSFDFSKSDNLPTASPSFYFSESKIFTKSEIFSQSEMFSNSIFFSNSKTLIPKSDIIINIKTDENNSMSTGLKAGIGILIGGSVLAAILVGLFLLRKRKLHKYADSDIDIQILDDNANSVITQNPLVDLLSEDDPFKDEFK